MAAITIVQEIITETKLTLDTLLPDYRRLKYEHDIAKNNEKGLTKSFGFIPKEASFKEGSAMGFTTMEHNFQLVMTTDYFNQDDDEAQTNAEQELYSQVHGILKDLQKSSITLPTSGYTVLLISGVDIEAPEHFNDNTLTALRTNFLITYRFRNN